MSYSIKNSQILRITVISILLLFVTSVLVLSSVNASEPSNWAEEEVDEAIALEAITDSLILNYQEGLTRAEFAELLVKTYESMIDAVVDISTVKNPFDDTDKVYLLKAYSVGIVSGTSATTFSPDQLVTREQLVVMMVRMIEQVELKLSVSILDSQMAVDPFEDQSCMATWAKASIDKAVANGIVSGVGDNRFNPKGNSSKEQAIIINYRLLMAIANQGEIATTWRENLVDYEADTQAVLNQNFGQYQDGETKAFVIADALNMRREPDLTRSDNIIRKLSAYEEVVILSEEGDWYKVAATGEEVGYVHSDYIHLYSPDESIDDIRMQMVAYAKQFIGTPYQYGNDSLTEGTDCSGLTGQIMRPFGYILSRSANGQSGNGIAITKAELKPGDLIFYGYNGSVSHVAMYVGNDEIIHATVNKGVIVTEMVGYLYKPLISYRSVIF